MRDEIVLERAQDILEELPLGIKPFALSVCESKSFPSSPTSHSPAMANAPSLCDPWSVLSPYWALLSSEVSALNEKILLLNASLKGVVMEIKGEVAVQDHLAPVYTSLAENMAPDLWKVF